MSVLYPRLVRVSRPDPDTGVGARPYGGLRQSAETVITTTTAHVQPDRQGKAPLEGLPGDAAGQPTWKIILRLPLGTVRKRDVLTDDQGTRYQVVYAAWGPLSTTVLAVELNGLGTPAALAPPFPGGLWDDLSQNWDAITDPWAPLPGYEALAANWDATSTNWDDLT